MRRSSGTASLRANSQVKLEIDDFTEEKHGPLSKRSKPSSSSPFDQLNASANGFPIPPSQYNPLDEPSPLGLRLKKSPSLLELIQMKLSQSNTSSTTARPSENLNHENKKDSRANATSSATDKLKASNFPASLLSIGCWEFVSKYEGDLVAKCYFAKHKLVWEILQGGLKRKIEVQWSDIIGLKACCPDNDTSSLTVVLARQPLFFRETNPQPRKHTLWQATPDFTDGQASINRQHFIQFPHGVLNKHYEKLIQCDARLNSLSQEPELVMDSPYFETNIAVLEKPDQSRGQSGSQIETTKGSPLSSSNDEASSAAQLSPLYQQQQDPITAIPITVSKEAPSPSSVMDTHAIEGSGAFEGCVSQDPKDWQQLKVPGIRPSMSMTDLMSHVGNCISQQLASGNLPSDKATECQDMLENFTQIWLSDAQNMPASNEEIVMKKVNSLCSLLQLDPATCKDGDKNHLEGPSSIDDIPSSDNVASKGDAEGVPGGKQTKGISRKDSYGDLLFQLPRIASLPKFLPDIAEDDEWQAK